ncbi:hypothetical protein D9M71_721110 [compost metagenome]
MGVGIEHTGHQHLATQVDDPGAFGLQTQHGLVGTYRDDLFAFDCHGLLQRLAWLGGVDLGVVQDQLHRGEARQARAGQAGADRHLQKVLHAVPHCCRDGAAA